MTWRLVVGYVSVAGSIAFASWNLRSQCPSESRPPSLETRRANREPDSSRCVTQIEVMLPSRTDQRREFAIRRNLFAYMQVAAPRSEERHAERNRSGEAIAVKADEPQVIVRSEPEFQYKYIGRFGPEADPIAVFVANGEVMIARVGDLVVGQFRVTGVGIDSVEVTSSLGSVRRLSVRP